MCNSYFLSFVSVKASVIIRFMHGLNWQGTIKIKKCMLKSIQWFSRLFPVPLILLNDIFPPPCSSSSAKAEFLASSDVVRNVCVSESHSQWSFSCTHWGVNKISEEVKQKVRVYLVISKMSNSKGCNLFSHARDEFLAFKNIWVD